MYRILAINLGSTSSKVAYYQDESCLIKENIEHSVAELECFQDILDQRSYRQSVIEDFLRQHSIDPLTLDAVVSRGGHTHPISGGVYNVDDTMLDEIRSGNFGRHACDIGVFIADSMSKQSEAKAFVVDPPVTDEFEPLARYSGLPELPRRSSFHALNQRAVAHKYSRQTGVPYEDLNLIVVHMGGGISVAAHHHGKMVDANNALTGDGPFSTNRTGGLPVGALVDLCFSGTYSKQEIKAKLNGKGGMVAYIGENDVKTVEAKALAGNETYKECLDAMLYQTAKEIGAAAAVLKGSVDAILLTGGIAHSQYVVNYLDDMVNYIGPLFVYPGEHEMEALALGAYNALSGNTEAKCI